MYIKNQKAACTTISEIIYHWHYGVNYRGTEEGTIHATRKIKQKWHNYIEIINALHDRDCKKFTFVRNPISRCISTYTNFFLDKKNIARKFHEKYMKKCGFSEEKSEEYNFDVFLLYIEKCLEADPYRVDNHFRLQFLNTMPHVTRYSFIGKVENISQDIKKLEDILGIRKRLKMKESISKSNRSINTYTPTKSQKAKIEEIFKIDFEYFGY